MTTNTGPADFPASFSVDGERFDVETLGWTMRRAVGGMVTADARAVDRLLPSPRLHALRCTPRRCWLSVGGAEYEWTAGSLPTLRSLDLQVLAMVTSGTRPAPPLLPLVGLMTNSGRAPFGAGFMPLLVITTNRVVRELYRQVFGWPAVLADVRMERLPGHVRIWGAEEGRMLLDTVARSVTQLAPFEESQPWYGVRDGHVFRAALSARGVGGESSGAGAMTLRLGDHPAVAPLHDLEVKESSQSCNVCQTFTATLVGPVVTVATASEPIDQPPRNEGITRLAEVSAAPGTSVPLEQALDRLPFDPAGEFRADPLTETPPDPGANQGQMATGTLGRVIVGAATAAQLAVPNYAPLFSRLLDLQPDDVYLDVACGAGVFLHRRAAHVHRVAGIDHSPVMVARARRLLADRIAAGTAEIVEGDATVLPWPDGTFTAVSSNCLDCFAPGKPAQTLAEIHRVLRPGGRILIGLEGNMADPDGAVAGMHPALQPAGRVLARAMKGQRYEDAAAARAYEARTGMSMLTDSELIAMLEDAGFADVTLDPGHWSVFATARRPEAEGLQPTDPGEPGAAGRAIGRGHDDSR